MGPLGAFFSHLFYVAEVVIIQNKKGLAKFGYIQYTKVLKQRSFYFLTCLSGANNKLKSDILEVFFFHENPLHRLISYFSVQFFFENSPVQKSWVHIIYES